MCRAGFPGVDDSDVDSDTSYPSDSADHSFTTGRAGLKRNKLGQFLKKSKTSKKSKQGKRKAKKSKKSKKSKKTKKSKKAKKH